MMIGIVRNLIGETHDCMWVVILMPIRGSSPCLRIREFQALKGFQDIYLKECH